MWAEMYKMWAEQTGKLNSNMFNKIYQDWKSPKA
jgi:hypothetical protein